MTQSRRLSAGLLIPVGVTLATLMVACGGGPAKSPNSSSMADSTSTRTAAAPEFNGTYKVTFDNGATNTWTVTPCGTGCADILSKPETDSEGGGAVGAPATRQAHLKDDTWSMSYLYVGGFVCPDGTETDMNVVQTWNATSLKGTFDATLHGPGCGEPDGSGTGPPEPFTLVKVS